MGQLLLLLTLTLLPPIQMVEPIEPLRLTVTPCAVVADDRDVLDRSGDGNAAVAWMRAGMLAHQTEVHGVPITQIVVAELNEQELRMVAATMDDVAEPISVAVAAGQCDWQLGRPSWRTLLPELQRLSSLNKVLAAEARLATEYGLVLRQSETRAVREFAAGSADAVEATVLRNVAQRLALASDIATEAWLVHGGIATDMRAAALIDLAAWMEQPGSSNHHALLDDCSLSLPLLAEMIEAEREGVIATFPVLDLDADGGEPTMVDIVRLLAGLNDFQTHFGATDTAFGAARAITLIGPANDWHLARGVTEEALRDIPVPTRLRDWMATEFDDWTQQQVDAATLPPVEAALELGKIRAAWERRESENPLLEMLPVVRKVPVDFAEAERLRVILMAIEAVRHHVAEHGRLPDTLDDVELAVPVDPLTGVAIGYEASGEHFSLTPPRVDGLTVNPRLERRIVVTLRAAE
ncbi:MAG: hypothetical protein AAF743_03450 [Planctomycetota bacterium]